MYFYSFLPVYFMLGQSIAYIYKIFIKKLKAKCDRGTFFIPSNIHKVINRQKILLSMIYNSIENPFITQEETYMKDI